MSACVVIIRRLSGLSAKSILLLLMLFFNVRTHKKKLVIIMTCNAYSFCSYFSACLCVCVCVSLSLCVCLLHLLCCLSLNQGLFMKYSLSGLLTTEQIIIFLYAIHRAFCVHLFVQFVVIFFLAHYFVFMFIKPSITFKHIRRNTYTSR